VEILTVLHAGGHVGAAHSTGDRREERAHENAENADDDQQLDQRETFI
jgi:hypothetical protein